MTSFIDVIVSPGAGPFTEVELQAQAALVREWREKLDEMSVARVMGDPFGTIQAALTGLRVAENRYAAMVLHNRIVAVQRTLLEKGI